MEEEDWMEDEAYKAETNWLDGDSIINESSNLYSLFYGIVCCLLIYNTDFLLNNFADGKDLWNFIALLIIFRCHSIAHDQRFFMVLLIFLTFLYIMCDWAINRIVTKYVETGTFKILQIVLHALIFVICLTKTRNSRVLSLIMLALQVWDVYQVFGKTEIFREYFSKFLAKKAPEITGSNIDSMVNNLLSFSKHLKNAAYDAQILGGDLKFAQDYLVQVWKYSDVTIAKTKAAILLIWPIWTLENRVFPAVRHSIRKQIINGGIMGFLISKLRIKGHFWVFATYFFLVSVCYPPFCRLIVNIGFKLTCPAGGLNSFLKVYGLACFAWLMASECLCKFQHRLYGQQKDLDHIQKRFRTLRFFAHFLGFILSERIWGMAEPKRNEALIKAFFILLIYFLACFRRLMRNLVTKKNIRPSWSVKCKGVLTGLAYACIMTAAVGIIWWCWVELTPSATTTFVIVFSVKLLECVVVDFLSFPNLVRQTPITRFTKRFRAVSDYVFHASMMLVLGYHVYFKLVNISWTTYFEALNLLFVNQIYISARHLYVRFSKAFFIRVFKLVFTKVGFLWHFLYEWIISLFTFVWGCPSALWQGFREWWNKPKRSKFAPSAKEIQKIKDRQAKLKTDKKNVIVRHLKKIIAFVILCSLVIFYLYAY